MRKVIVLFAVFICAIFAMTSFGTANAEKVLVNIWDGTEWTKIQPLFDGGSLPNAASVGELHHLTCNTECFPGCGCNNCCMRTATKTQHATMLTGFLADIHGVFSNGYYQLIPDGLTVYEKIEASDNAIKTAHISSKSGNIGESTFGNIVGDIDYFVARQGMSPKAAADIARGLIDQWSGEDFFIVCHFRKPDATGHSKGVNSQDYEDAIVACDNQLGRILSRLRTQGILDETKIYVLSDHGFGTPDPYGHNNAPNTFIISNNGMRDSYMNEVAGYLLNNFGLEERKKVVNETCTICPTYCPSAVFGHCQPLGYYVD